MAQNRRAFIEYEAPVLHRFIEKQKKNQITSQNTLGQEPKLQKSHSATLTKLSQEEILKSFNEDLTATFFFRNPKTAMTKKEEAIKEDKKADENKKPNLVSTLNIHKLNFKLDPPKDLEECKVETNDEQGNPTVKKPKRNPKQQVLKTQPTDHNIIESQASNPKEKAPELIPSSQPIEIKKTIEKDNQSKNQIKITKTILKEIEEPIQKENPEKNDFKKNISSEFKAEEPKSKSLENKKKPAKNKKNRKIEDNRQENGISPPGEESSLKENENSEPKPNFLENSLDPSFEANKPQENQASDQILPVKTVKKARKPRKVNTRLKNTKKGTDPEELPKLKSVRRPTAPKPPKISEESKDNPPNENKPKKDFKQIHEKNENLVRLNLKRIYKDRFRGQIFNYKNNYKSNGRPKAPRLFGRARILHIKSYKIEQLLHGMTLCESDPFLSSLSESLKIPVLLPNMDSLKLEIPETTQPYIPDKAPQDFTDEDYRLVLQRNFGFDDFRPGQLDAIRNIVNRRSTLVILHTGLGKSLIYSFSSFLMPGMTVVISPLVSLMFDQVEKLPKCIPGACLNSMLKPEDRVKIHEMIREGKIKILYISPEALETSFMLDLSTKINFVCIDEIHCVSEWSHNFRTSYLKLSYLIRERLKTDLVLGLTATATSRTISSITKSFKLEEVVQSRMINRSNLFLSVSRDQDKFPALLSLLRSPKFAKLKSIIIYCTLIRTTENVANYLSQSGVGAIPYHSECHESTRLKIQKQFMSGQIRIVVATLAFGMGIDKKDVDCIIHLNMPKSLENYIQEVGRSGRNGKPSFCHLFLTDEDFFRMRGYILAESLDEMTLRKLIKRVFKRGMKTQDAISSKRKWLGENQENEEEDIIGKIAFIPETDLCSDLECTASMLMTVLNRIEEFTAGKFEMFPLSKVACSLRFYKSSPEEVKGKYEIIDKAMSLARNKNGSFNLNVIKLSNLVEKKPLEVMQQIQKLGYKEGISFELNTPAFCFKVKEELSEEEVENLVEYILRRNNQIEKQMLYKIDSVYLAFKRSSYYSVNKMIQRDYEEAEKESEPMENLKKVIQNYFEYDGDDLECLFKDIPDYKQILPFMYLETEEEAQKIKIDVMDFLRRQLLSKEFSESVEFYHKILNPKNLIRIIQGVNSTSISYKEFKQYDVWGKYYQYQYEQLLPLMIEISEDFQEVYNLEQLKKRKKFF